MLNTARGRKLILACFDILCFVVIDIFYCVTNRLSSVGVDYSTESLLVNSLILIFSMMFFRVILNVYRNIWRYSSSVAYLGLILADALGGISAVIVSRVAGYYQGHWFMMTVASLTALLTLSSRYVYRFLYKRRNRASKGSDSGTKVAIVGSGTVGVMLLSHFNLDSERKIRTVMFIDNNREKIGQSIKGIPIYGEDESVLTRIKDSGVEEIYFALRDIDSDKANRLLHFYENTGCRFKIYDTPVRETEGTGRPDESQNLMVRDFSIEDLFFREPVVFADKKGFDSYAGKVVLVTGGGGSIGSELARQLARCNPSKLIIVDIYENNAYDLQQDLIKSYKELDLCVEIASVRDLDRMDRIFAFYRPDVVFHAAAHKHVPLMEHSGEEAVKNNVFGTLNVVKCAEKYSVSRFVLISTDKAVNPTNVMGASKRLCEMIVNSRSQRNTNTCFTAVRFGNVLGSNGSVIPLFKRQIREGGPVTVTDKRIIRYFMTIPEAAQLVMLSGAMAKNGELFVLDMGRPVKIYDLAVNMIRLSGLTPDVDIKIEEIGLRPGEKLYEELLTDSETLTKTDNNMIFIEKDDPISEEEMREKLKILLEAVKSGPEIGSDEIKEAVKKVVPTFKEPGAVNIKAVESREMKEALA